MSGRPAVRRIVSEKRLGGFLEELDSQRTKASTHVGVEGCRSVLQIRTRDGVGHRALLQRFDVNASYRRAAATIGAERDVVTLELQG